MSWVNRRYLHRYCATQRTDITEIDVKRPKEEVWDGVSRDSCFRRFTAPCGWTLRRATPWMEDIHREGNGGKFSKSFGCWWEAVILVWKLWLQRVRLPRGPVQWFSTKPRAKFIQQGHVRCESCDGVILHGSEAVFLYHGLQAEDAPKAVSGWYFLPVRHSPDELQELHVPKSDTGFLFMP